MGSIPLLSVLVTSFRALDNVRRNECSHAPFELQVAVRQELTHLSVLAHLACVPLNRPTWTTVV